MTDTPQGEVQTPQPSPPPKKSQNRTIMLILSYLGILALIPLLVETEDSEIQWHAKHGIILMVGWIVLGVVLMIVSTIPAVGWIFGCALGPILWLAILVIHLVCIIKAINGQQFRLPVVSDFADQWK